MQMHASLQRKFSFSYIAIILAVLILLNTYPLITSENLTFRSKQSSLQGSVSVMVTALSGLEELSEENVAGAMTLVEETGIEPDRKSTRLNSSHSGQSRMPSSA